MREKTHVQNKKSHYIQMFDHLVATYETNQLVTADLLVHYIYSNIC